VKREIRSAERGTRGERRTLPVPRSRFTVPRSKSWVATVLPFGRAQAPLRFKETAASLQCLQPEIKMLGQRDVLSES